MGSDASKCVLTGEEARARLGFERLGIIESVHRQLTGVGGPGVHKGLSAETFRTHFLQCAFPSVPSDVAKRIFSLLDTRGKGGLTVDETILGVALIYCTSTEEQARFASLLASAPSASTQGTQGGAVFDAEMWNLFLRHAERAARSHGAAARPPVGHTAPQIHAIERGVAEHYGMPRSLFDNIVAAHDAWRAKNTEAANVIDARLVKRTSCSGAGGVANALLGVGSDAKGAKSEQTNDLPFFSVSAPTSQPMNNHRSHLNLLFHAFYAVLLHSHSSGVVTLLDLVSAIAVWRHGSAPEHAQYTLRVFRQYWVTFVELQGLLNAKYSDDADPKLRQRKFARMLLLFMLKPDIAYATLSLAPTPQDGSAGVEGSHSYYEGTARGGDGDAEDTPKRRLCVYNNFVDLDLDPILAEVVSEGMVEEVIAELFSGGEVLPVNSFNPSVNGWDTFWGEFLLRHAGEEEEAGEGEEGGEESEEAKPKNGRQEALHSAFLTAAWRVVMVEAQIRPETREEEVQILTQLQTVSWKPAFSYYLVQAEWWRNAMSVEEVLGAGAGGAAQTGRANGGRLSTSGMLNLAHQSEKINESLLADHASTRLKPGLIQDKDYTIVTRGAWKACTAWYRVGPPLARRQVEVSAEGEAVVEAYPFAVRCVVGTPPEVLPTSASVASLLDTSVAEVTPAAPLAASAVTDPNEYIRRNDNFERYPEPDPAPSPSASIRSAASPIITPPPLLSDRCLRETMLPLTLPQNCTVREMVARYLEVLVAPSHPYALRSTPAHATALAKVADAMKSDEFDAFSADQVRVYLVGRRYTEVLLAEVVCEVEGMMEGDTFLLQLPGADVLENVKEDVLQDDEGKDDADKPTHITTPKQLSGGLRYGSKIEAYYYTLKDNSHYNAHYRNWAAPVREGGGVGPTPAPRTHSEGGEGGNNKSTAPARGVVREIIPHRAGEEGPDDIIYMSLVGKELRRWLRRSWITKILAENETWRDCSGQVGLCNLGNTCYMNAALQALSHTPLIRDYFLHHSYYAWDVSEKTTWEGMNGQVAIVFAELLESLWCTPDNAARQFLLGGGENGEVATVPPGPVTPKRFRDVIATFDPEYALNRQQDAQEFLAVLLNALKIDLSKECTEEYVAYQDADGRSDADVADERWHDFVKRQNSIVTNVFTSQFKTSTVCVGCKREMRTFETLDMLQVPLPELDHTFQTVYVHPHGATINMSLKVNKQGSTIATLLERVEEVTPEVTMPSAMHSPVVVADAASAVARSHRFVAVTLTREALVEKYIPPNTKVETINPNTRIHLYLVSYPHDSALAVQRTESAMSSVSANSMNKSVNSPRGQTAQALFLEVVHRKRTTVPGSEGIVGARQVQYRTFSAAPTLLAPLQSFADASRQSAARQGFNEDEFCSRLYEDVWQASRWMLPEYHLVPDYITQMATGSEETTPAPRPSEPPTQSSFGLNKRFPFILKVVGVDGSGCTRCNWVKGCSGCAYNPRQHGVILKSGEKLAADWDAHIWEVYGNTKIARSVGTHSSVVQHREEMGRGITTTLPFCLDSYSAEETREMRCPTCKEETEHTARIGLWRLPPVFVVHLKRFLYSNGGVKINGLVDFPVSSFDLAPWTCPSSPHVANSLYELYAVVYHKGSLTYGHYYANVLCGGKWYCCDDTDVSEIPESRVVTPEAYVLLYRHKEGGAEGGGNTWPQPARYPLEPKDVLAIKTAPWSKNVSASPARKPAAVQNGKGKCVVS